MHFDHILFFVTQLFSDPSPITTHSNLYDFSNLKTKQKNKQHQIVEALSVLSKCSCSWGLPWIVGDVARVTLSWKKKTCFSPSRSYQLEKASWLVSTYSPSHCDSIWLELMQVLHKLSTFLRAHLSISPAVFGEHCFLGIPIITAYHNLSVLFLPRSLNLEGREMMKTLH